MNRQSPAWQQYICRVCGLIYDEKLGDPDSGLAPGTRFKDIPDDWECPLCGVTKVDFELFEKTGGTGKTTATEKIGSTVAGQSPHFSNKPSIVIVGGGLAGWSTVEAIRQRDQQIAVTLVTACQGDRYHKPELSLAISRGQNKAALIKETGPDAARRLGVRLMSETFVVGLTSSLHQLRTTRGSLIYTKLVLAQGAKPALPEQLPPSLCWRVNDLACWSGMQQALSKGPQQIAIVGAGMIGCEIAEDLVRAGHKVTLLDRNKSPLASLLPELASQRLAESLSHLGITYMGNDEITGLSALENEQKLIQFKRGQPLQVDLVLAATGLVTDQRIVRHASLDFNHGITVDPKTLQTSAADIYALGDCINIQGIPCRFIEPIKHQAASIAHEVLHLEPNTYAHRAPIVRLKTRSLPVVMNGRPLAGIEWTLVHEDDEGLVMEQRHNNHVIASLKVGICANNQSADNTPSADYRLASSMQ